MVEIYKAYDNKATQQKGESYNGKRIIYIHRPMES